MSSLDKHYPIHLLDLVRNKDFFIDPRLHKQIQHIKENDRNGEETVKREKRVQEFQIRQDNGGDRFRVDMKTETETVHQWYRNFRRQERVYITVLVLNDFRIFRLGSLETSKYQLSKGCPR